LPPITTIVVERKTDGRGIRGREGERGGDEKREIKRKTEKTEKADERGEKRGREARREESALASNQAGRSRSIHPGAAVTLHEAW
jgi:hypothetical protein